MSPQVVIVAAPSTRTAAMRDVLRDWVALGLVQPFLWVDSSSVEPGGSMSAVVATHVTATGAPRVLLQAHLADQRDISLVRLVLLGSAGGEHALVAPEVARTVEEYWQAAMPGVVVQIQVLAVEHGDGGWTPEVALPGWRTLVLAPEDAWSPSRRQPAYEFAAGGDPAELVAHSAAGLAACAALWTGMDAGPFDGADAGDLVAVRAYLRRLDTARVTAALRQTLLDVGAKLPCPMTGRARAVTLQHPEEAAERLVGAVWAKHTALLEFELEPPTPPRTRQIGARAAIKAFLVFLGAAVRNAPQRAVDVLLNVSAGAISNEVQRLLFGGSDSNYRVVTRGITSDGLPAGVDAISEAAVDVRARVAPVLSSERTTPDSGPFWRSIVGGALSLADGGSHVVGVGPVLVGATPGVVAEPGLIAPRPDDVFELPASVAAQLGRTTLPPYDAHLEAQTATIFDELPGNDSELTRAGERFQQWRQRVSSTYTGQVASQLAADVDARRAALAQLLARLEQPVDDGDSRRAAEQVGSGRRIMLQWAAGLLILGVVAVVVMGVVDVLPNRWVVVAAALLFVGWTTVHGGRLIGVQRRLFALIHARRDTQDELALAARNVSRAAQALHVSTTLYRQHLQWAPVLGRFLSEPFGPVPSPADTAHLHGTLPRAVGFGVAETDPKRVMDVAHELGTSVYETGWLRPLWEVLVNNAGAQLGREGLTLREDPSQLWSDEARDERSPLRLWSQWISAEGVAAGAGEELWRKARGVLLAGGPDELVQRLLTSVEVQAQDLHDGRSKITGREFFTGLTDALADLDRHIFQPDLFTAQAKARDLHHVQRTIVFGPRAVADLGAQAPRGTSATLEWVEPTATEADTLDQFIVVVQSSVPAPASALHLRGGRVPLPEIEPRWATSARLDLSG